MHKESVADLVTVNYAKLLQNDKDEIATLYSTCAQCGFFYLDLEGSEPDKYLDIVNELFEVSKQYFAKPLVEKLKDTRDEANVFNICGYKPLGQDLGNVKDKKDGGEGLRIPADLLYNPAANPRLSVAEGIKNDWRTVADFIEASNTISCKILRSLSDFLGLSGEERFESHHQPSSSTSASAAVLQCYPLADLPPNTSVGHFTHTDSGSISVLFCSEWGLQVYSSQQDSWDYVAPRENCAVVNVGDSLRFLSSLKFKSCLHRVVPCPEQWKSGSRYSCSFFLRANAKTRFTDSEGTLWTADDWFDRKFGGYRRSHQEQELTAISTGKRGFSGLWETE